MRWSISSSLCLCVCVCINLDISFLNPTKYSVLVLLLILVELGCAAFIFFDKSWKEVSCHWQFRIWNSRSYICNLIIVFLPGNSYGQNWRFWYDIWIPERELEYCEMGCSWNCHLWGKLEQSWLAFFKKKKHCYFMEMLMSLSVYLQRICASTTTK